MKFGVIIPAAGRGRRMNAALNKQFLEIENHPVLLHTLKVFLEYFSSHQIVVVVRAEEREYCQREIIGKYKLNNIKLTVGGKTRRESVYAGLKSFSQTPDYVIIHDGARPLLSYRVLSDIIYALDENNAVAAGIEVKNTIKIKNKDDFICKTLDRDRLVSIQTPQAFSYKLIIKAHEEVSSEAKISDDASLVELLNHPVKVIPGSHENIKITTPVDLFYARAILQSRREQK